MTRMDPALEAQALMLLKECFHQVQEPDLSLLQQSQFDFPPIKLPSQLLKGFLTQSFILLISQA